MEGRCHLLFICRVRGILEDLKEVKALPAEPLWPVEEKKTNESCRIEHPARQQGFPPQPREQVRKELIRAGADPNCSHCSFGASRAQEKRTQGVKRQITWH